jgi:hypothetical protein
MPPNYEREMEDPDYGAGGIPDFADDASFGGSGDDYVVTDRDGAPLLANTGNARDWLRDTLAGRSSVDEEDYGGTFDDPTSGGESVDIPLRDTGDSGGSGSTIGGSGPAQSAVSTEQIEAALARLGPSRAASSPTGAGGLSTGTVVAIVAGAAAVVGSVVLSDGDGS